MATKTKTTDDAVMELLVTVQEKKAEIKSLKKRPQWKTNCSFGIDPDSTHDRKNIQVERNPRTIVNWYVFLLEMEERHAQASHELGLPVDLTHLAYPIADWKDDLKARANQLIVEQKQKEMEKLDTRVNMLVSPDQRRAMELEALQQILAE